MKLSIATLLAVAVCARFSGQAVPPVQAPTFHIQGTVTDPIGSVIRNAKITFLSKKRTETVVTDDTGRYSAELPLGDYTMNAHSTGFETYRRPPFRVLSPASLVFDVNL
jgi:hypothetical protein